ncbi:MAG TPA: DUF3224 domain-containing protein [Thermoanaerobaculia bacterium]
MKRLMALSMLVVAALAASAEEKGKPMSQRASGTFEVKLEPLAGDAFPRLALKKDFHGDLEGTSAGEMMSVQSEGGSGAYVALERFTGTLKGRKGSFVLVHSGTMRRGGDFQMIIRVVPDSGTEALAGIAGTLEIVIEGSKHSYHLEYSLPES